jgi:DNA repair protein RadD
MSNPYTLRGYQQDAVDSTMDYLSDKKAKKPALIVMPTGSGKAHIIASIAEMVKAPLLVFQPTREILQQNYNKMMDYGIMGVTIFSASMNRKEIGNITLATIGSTHRVPHLFKEFKHVIVDESHLISANSGMYKTFLEDVGDKVIGLTATPYRLSHDGYGGTIVKFLTRTNPRFFSKVIHVTQTKFLSENGFFAKTEYFSIEGFERGKIKINSTGADYIEESERAYYDKISFHNNIIDMVQRVRKAGKKRILVFTKFVEEAIELSKQLGDKCAYVSGDLDTKIRADIIKKFKAGDIEVVCNVGVLTTGFDYPELEVAILARPTRSLGLYYQMIGRICRPHPLKEEAWVIDLCGNFRAFGRVEDLDIVEQKPNIWQVVSNGRHLTNVYLNDINNI